MGIIPLRAATGEERRRFTGGYGGIAT